MPLSFLRLAYSGVSYFQSGGIYEKIKKEIASIIKADIISTIEDLADDAKKKLSLLGNDIKTIANKTEETVKQNFTKVEDFFKRRLFFELSTFCRLLRG